MGKNNLVSIYGTNEKGNRLCKECLIYKDETNFYKNPNAIHLLEQNIAKINWTQLSMNTDALHLLAPLDCLEMQRTFQPLAKELIERVFHPTRVSRIAHVYGMDLNEYLEFHIWNFIFER